MRRVSKLCALVALVAGLLGPAAGAQQTSVADLVAVDIMLEPDTALISNAQVVNARLKQNYPQGFPLDAAHAPHVTLVQLFVHQSELNELAKELSRVMGTAPPLPIKMRTSAYSSAQWAGVGLVSYVVDRTPELLQLESRIVDATRRFAVSGGGPEAFANTTGEQINADTIKAVDEYAARSVGQNYQPHVTLGAGKAAFVQALTAEPFKPFTFNGVNIAIYRLGNYGTLQQRLWGLKQ